ncbi:MAG: peroxidase-related enzyme [Planctomycetes bacterium]|nr:peroxidase-related enzyme [Planctomycetota bacterium]
MVWIHTLTDQEASADPAALRALDGARSPDGRVAEALRAQALAPAALAAHFEFYKTIMFGRSPLSRRLREMIALTVATATNCGHLKQLHAKALRQVKTPAGVVEALLVDFRDAAIFERERALLAYAHRVATRPDDVREEEVQALRRHGYDDRAILDAATLAAYFSFLARFVLSLGVAAEEAASPAPPSPPPPSPSTGSGTASGPGLPPGPAR